MITLSKKQVLMFHSYVIFPILETELEELMELAEEVGQRIGLAKDM